MKRYDADWLNRELLEDPEGDLVLFAEAQSEIERLQAQLADAADRDRFEVWYVQHAQEQGVDIGIGAVQALRRGDCYASNLGFLKGAWAGWRARK